MNNITLEELEDKIQSISKQIEDRSIMREKSEHKKRFYKSIQDTDPFFLLKSKDILIDKMDLQENDNSLQESPEEEEETLSYSENENDFPLPKSFGLDEETFNQSVTNYFNDWDQAMDQQNEDAKKFKDRFTPIEQIGQTNILDFFPNRKLDENIVSN